MPSLATPRPLAFLLALAACVLTACVLAAPRAALAQEEPSGPGEAEALPVVELDTVEVVGVTPTHGLGVPLRSFPANVRRANAADYRRLQSLDFTSFMGAAIGSVHLNNLGSNPLQSDVSFRGFRGSPLLGLPQEITVYQDGARVNETFGDVINWDLLPESAIASVEVIPGSNPVFGRNTLGGAISLRTKSGFSHPGLALQGGGASYQRLLGSASYGGHNGSLGYFVALEGLDEAGWRDFSSSNAVQGFGKLTYLRERTVANLSLTGARTDLRGNGAVPVELLSTDRNAVFTHPDNTQNTMGMATLQVAHRLADAVRLSGTAYGRITQTDTFNGDDSDYGPCPDTFDAEGVADPDDALCLGGDDDDDDLVANDADDDNDDDDEIRQVFDQDGAPVPSGDAFASATQNTTVTDQLSYGVAVQATVARDLAGRTNQLMAGASFDGGQADFTGQTELARLTANRGTEGSGRIDFGEPSEGDFGSRTQVEATTRTASLFFTDTFTPVDPLAVTVSGRYNVTNVVLDDQLGTALDGNHTFQRFNPAFGATYTFAPEANVFANLSWSSRAPTPVELSCADPDDPCRLPNGFQADPPLDQVVARTVSGGLRGTLAPAGIGAITYSAAVFRTDADDDLYFVSAGPARNSGFFTNIGTTRRQGVELSLNGQTGRVTWYSHYTFTDATFQSFNEAQFIGNTPAINSPNHPAAGTGGVGETEIPVEAGDRLPLTPRHVAKAGVDVAVVRGLTLGTNATYTGAQFFRGDEGNLLDQLDGYTVIDLRARYDVYRGFEVFGVVTNVFGTEFATAGLLGEPDEVAAFENFENPRFLTPGAPRFIRLGVGYTF